MGKKKSVKVEGIIKSQFILNPTVSHTLATTCQSLGPHIYTINQIIIQAAIPLVMLTRCKSLIL